jgi:cytosine/adenosine deaminase-related metal-dependent hydrolase
MARAAGGPRALSTRQALEMATLHGARCLGRDDELGHLSAGAVADVALWNLDDAAHAGLDDPVAALVLGPQRAVDTLLVGGEVVVAGGELRTADDEVLARELARESRRLRERAP